MPPTDDGELRALQQKAYGRDGGLTDAEAARLRELEDERDAAASVGEQPDPALVRAENSRSGGGIGAEAPPDGEFSSRTHAAAAPERASAVPEHASADTAHASAALGHDGVAEQRVLSSPVVAVSDGAAGSSGGARGALRQHWRVVAAASALLLAIGVGAGWALFGRGVLPVLIPESQQAALALIEGGTYDPGSIRFVGEKHGVGIWHATRDGGTRECIVVTREGEQASECRVLDADTDENAFIGVSAGLDFEEDGQNVMVWATFLPDISGEEVTLVQRSVVEEGIWEEQYTDAERADIDRLEQEGFGPNGLQLVGYDDDLPLWQGWRADETCLMAVVASEVHVACRDINAGGDTVSLRLGTTDYELRETQTRGPMFSITRNAPAAGKADPLELGGEHGDPITVTPDDTEP